MEPQPVVVPPGQGHRVGNVEFLARTGDTPRFTFSIIDIAPGRELEAHVHPDEDDAFYIVEGGMTFIFCDQSMTAPPGTFVPPLASRTSDRMACGCAARDNESVPGDEGESRVFRRAGISYLRIPAKDPQETAAFYRSVFGWTVDTNRPDPSFEDGSGHVIGHFMAEPAVAGEAGVRPYIYVERIDDTLEKVSAHGGTTVVAPYPEGDLWVATFRDPAGNVLGVWQRGPRE